MFQKIKDRIRQEDYDYFLISLATVGAGVGIGWYCSRIVYTGKLELIMHMLDTEVNIPDNLIASMNRTGEGMIVCLDDGSDVILKLVPKS